MGNLLWQLELSRPQGGEVQITVRLRHHHFLLPCSSESRHQTFKCEKNVHLGIFIYLQFVPHIIPKSKIVRECYYLYGQYKSGQGQVKADCNPVKGAVHWLLVAIRNTRDR